MSRVTFTFYMAVIIGCSLLIAATSSKVTSDLLITPRTEIVIESPQPNGREIKQVVVEVEDLVTSFQYKGVTFVNTNTYTPSNAIIRIISADPRRAR